jgi:hypothetical protein
VAFLLSRLLFPLRYKNLGSIQNMQPWAPLVLIGVGSGALISTFIYTASTVSSSDNFNSIKKNITISSILNIVSTLIFMIGIGFHISANPASADRVMLYLIGVSILVSLSALTISLLDKSV